jgi:hypothetical protein
MMHPIFWLAMRQISMKERPAVVIPLIAGIQ